MGEVKELELFRRIRNISRIYDKGSVGKTDSEAGAENLWKGKNVLIFEWTRVIDLNYFEV
mgnify:CR=1 FL=1